MAENIKLTNPETAQKYEADTAYDQHVDIPALKGNGTCYRGKISGITLEAADRYVKFGGNLIKAKEPVGRQNGSSGSNGSTQRN